MTRLAPFVFHRSRMSEHSALTELGAGLASISKQLDDVTQLLVRSTGVDPRLGTLRAPARLGLVTDQRPAGDCRMWSCRPLTMEEGRVEAQLEGRSPTAPIGKPRSCQACGRADRRYGDDLPIG